MSLQFEYPNLEGMHGVRKVILAKPFFEFKPGLLARPKRCGSVDWWLHRVPGESSITELEHLRQVIPYSLILMEESGVWINMPRKQWWRLGMVHKWFDFNGQDEGGFHPKSVYLFGRETVLTTVGHLPAHGQYLIWEESMRQRPHFEDAVFISSTKDEHSLVFALLPGKPVPETPEFEGAEELFKVN